MAETLKDLFVHHIHYYCLGFMAVVYFFKIRWILKYPAPGERTPPRGSHKEGIKYSLLTIARPSTMESSAKNPMRWFEFVLFHLGVTVGITCTILMPHAEPFFFQPAVAWTLRVIMVLACLIGIVRVYRRLTDPALKAITHADDLFAVGIIVVWFAVAFFGIAPFFGTATSVDTYTHTADVWACAILFILTSFLLVYVPFSKISHYIFWPFQRYYIGKHLGHRGVYPKVEPAS